MAYTNIKASQYRDSSLLNFPKKDYLCKRITNQNNDKMNYMGILTGLATFLIIGLFHPLVIKGEYYFGTKCWWGFLLLGLLCGGLSLYTENLYGSIIFGVTSFSSFWGILEVFDQRKRVLKGWFPKNPKRMDDYK